MGITVVSVVKLITHPIDPVVYARLVWKRGSYKVRAGVSTARPKWRKPIEAPAGIASYCEIHKLTPGVAISSCFVLYRSVPRAWRREHVRYGAIRCDPLDSIARASL